LDAPPHLKTRKLPIFNAAESRESTKSMGFGIRLADENYGQHTFAVELSKHGVPAGMAATLLGNTERIFGKRYSGWIDLGGSR
jgi:hypothetical protein